MIGVGLPCVAWGRRGQRRRYLALALLALCLLGFASTGWRAAQRLGHGLNPALEGADLVLTGRVADMPQVDADGLRFLFHVNRAERAGQALAVPPRIWLGWGRGWQEDTLLAGPPAALQWVDPCQPDSKAAVIQGARRSGAASWRHCQRRVPARSCPSLASASRYCTCCEVFPAHRCVKISNGASDPKRCRRGRILWPDEEAQAVKALARPLSERPGVTRRLRDYRTAISS